VARLALPKAERVPYVFAYHEIVESPREGTAAFSGTRCDVVYQGRISPDFYGWVFPHGPTTSIGVGSAQKGFALREATRALRRDTRLDQCRTIRMEGAPIPLRPRKRWDNGRDVIVAGDAAGVVAPASGEGIYYAMACGRMAADAVERSLATGDARALQEARRGFMKAHGRVFWVLGWLQWVWYASDKRREKFVGMCRDPDVQRLTWESYMNKRLVRREPAAHLRVLMKDIAQLVGLKAP
jgi:geranylgeranyl reductase